MVLPPLLPVSAYAFHAFAYAVGELKISVLEFNIYMIQDIQVIVSHVLFHEEVTPYEI